MINRKLNEMGLVPAMAYLLMLSLFLAVSALLFERVNYAQYIYFILPLSFLPRLSDAQRTDFLKTIFFGRQYKTIRLIENLLIALPFALFLSWKHCFFAIIPLMTISVLFSLINIRQTFSFVLPTPFSKHPFEFSVGFRNIFLLFPIAYFLTIMAIMHDNFNLGAVAMGLMFLVVCTFYFRADNEYYVWIFNLSSSHFLHYKIKKAIVCTFSLCTPILLALGVFYFESSWILLLGLLLGILFLTMIIFAKYAAFPNDIGLGEMTAFTISAIFPPMLFVLIFYFRNRAIQKLNTILK
jgi:hypothetical protein